MDVFVAAILVCGAGGEEGAEAGRTKAVAVAPRRRKDRAKMQQARLLVVVLVVAMACVGVKVCLCVSAKGMESLTVRCKKQKPPRLPPALEHSLSPSLFALSC